MVSYCVCFGVEFEEILNRISQSETLEDIVKDTGAGTNCGMCQPYIKLSIIRKTSTHSLSDIKSHSEEINRVENPSLWD